MEQSGSIIDGNAEHFLFTYSEEEKQNNEINKANASLVFSPAYIILHTFLLDYMTVNEALLFGFIEYYLGSEKGKRFYFTNKQLAEILRIGERTAQEAVVRLEKLGCITTSRKVRAGGGQIRFINSITKDVKTRLANSASLTSKKVPTNILNKKKTINKNIHSTAIADTDVFSFFSICTATSVASRKECTLLFGKFKTFDQIAELVVEAKRWSSVFGWEDHPTVRALKGLDLYMKNHNNVQEFMDIDFENNVDYESRSDREEQLYYCRGNSQPHY